MNTSRSSVWKAGSRLVGFISVSVAVGAGFAAAETFQHGGSTTIIEQLGGGGTSTSEVTRYEDGHRIVTQDGSNKDITVQRSDGYPSSSDSWEYPDSSADRFDSGVIEERLSRSGADGSSVGDCSGCSATSARKAFKQQVLERMHSGFLP